MEWSAVADCAPKIKQAKLSFSNKNIEATSSKSDSSDIIEENLNTVDINIDEHVP